MKTSLYLTCLLICTSILSCQCPECPEAPTTESPTIHTFSDTLHAQSSSLPAPEAFMQLAQLDSSATPDTRAVAEAKTDCGCMEFSYASERLPMLNPSAPDEDWVDSPVRLFFTSISISACMSPNFCVYNSVLEVTAERETAPDKWEAIPGANIELVDVELPNQELYWPDETKPNQATYLLKSPMKQEAANTVLAVELKYDERSLGIPHPTEASGMAEWETSVAIKLCQPSGEQAGCPL